MAERPSEEIRHRQNDPEVEIPVRVSRKENSENADENSPVARVPKPRGKRLQHPAELPRDQPAKPNAAQLAARRAYEKRYESSRIGPAEPSPPPTPAKEMEPNQDGHIADNPEDYYRGANEQQKRQRTQTRRSSRDGSESVQSRRTSNQNQGQKTHRRQLSEAEMEFYNRMSQPRHITPKREAAQRNSRGPQDRGPSRANGNPRAMASQRGVELPFDGHWSNQRIEREEGGIRIPTEAMFEQMDQPQPSYDPFSGLTSLLGWDSRRQINAMEGEIMSLRKRLWHSQKNNHELKGNLADLSRQNDALQGDLRKVQQKSFNQITKSAWTPLEDRAIQEALQEIHQDLEDWADDNCLESFAEILERLPEPRQAELLELCKDVIDITQPDLVSQFKWWAERKLDPVLLLTALATYHMYSCVFNNEFLAIGALEVDGSVDPMTDVYRKLAELDFKQAHVWRSQLMRIMIGIPQSGGRFDGVSSKLDISSFIKRYCDDLLDDFGQHAEAAFLKEPLTLESRETLLNCWTRAAELFVQLQTQVTVVQWKATQMLRHTFNSLYVESHRSQAYPEGRNDGKLISLVITPMVAFFGNEDGERYDTSRTVCKGTILVISEEVEESEEEEEFEELPAEENEKDEYGWGLTKQEREEVEEEEDAESEIL